MKISKRNYIQYAFTLAEVMITLVIIGIIAAIVIPVAIHSAPDESVLKFKKGHDTLYKVISTLVNSDQYYLDGDLGVKADGTAVNGSTSATDDTTYFCQTFADVVSVKSVNCSNLSTGYKGRFSTESSNLSSIKISVDIYCNYSGVIDNAGSEIVTSDDIVYYQVAPLYTFGQSYYSSTDSLGMYSYYKTFCMDIDGISMGEAPFGYSIRKDGRIIAGNRAQVWLNKSIQGDD